MTRGRGGCGAEVSEFHRNVRQLQQFVVDEWNRSAHSAHVGGTWLLCAVVARLSFEQMAVIHVHVSDIDR